VEAHLLRDVLIATADPAARLVNYQQRVKIELEPFFEVMRNADRSAISRARRALKPSTRRPSLVQRITRSFMLDGVAIAVRSDVDLFRATQRGLHMLEDPRAWLRRPGNFIKVLGYWARGKRANADAYRPADGPGRREMLLSLGVSPDLDAQQLLAKAA
jgi:hypothetical protein